jgi:hypothetical protein
MPPFFKLTLVVLCAYIIWSFNHPEVGPPRNFKGTMSLNRPVRHLPAPYPAGTGQYHNPNSQLPQEAPNNLPINLNINPDDGKAAPAAESNVFPECNTGPANNVVFLKTHKTGSSTMSNIMLRFADQHNLTVGLPLEGKWELGGYPAYIDKQLIDPKLDQYNVLGHHFRFNKQKLDSFMAADTRYVTIIRSPVDNVESVFGFFQDQLPFMNWLETINTTERLGAFYKNPEGYYNTDTDWFFRSKNHMFFDIGYDVNRDNDAEYVAQSIQEMDSFFTLILLTDFFDESLILMKRLLCWDWKDIVYIKFKMRTDDSKAEVNVDLADRIRKWNNADTKLYDYFNQTFWRKVDAYGRDQMDKDLLEFRKKQKEAETECIDSYQPFKKKPWILGAKLKPKPSDFCKHLAWSETVYGEFLRDKMYQTIPGLAKPTEERKTELNNLFEQIAGGALRSS